MLFALLTAIAVGAPAPPQSAPEGPTINTALADESIYVVQERAYLKRGKVELTPFFFLTMTNKFSSSLGPGLALVYHPRENLAIEVSSTVPHFMRSHYSSLVYELHDDEQLAPEPVDLKKLKYFGAVTLQFSALYGKFDFYGHLIDYDFYGSAGPGLAVTVEACAPAGEGTCGPDTELLGHGLRAPLDAADHYKIAGNLAGGLRLFFSDSVGARLELRDVVYADRAGDAPGVTTDIRNNVMLLGGVSFLL
jgi:outer membrane beta-barrel protein